MFNMRALYSIGKVSALIMATLRIRQKKRSNLKRIISCATVAADVNASYVLRP